MSKLLYVLLFMILNFSLVAQNDSKSFQPISLSIHQGFIWYPDNAVSANTTGVQVKLSFCELHPRLCPTIKIKWKRIAERIDIPPSPPIIVRPWPLPLPPTDPWELFDFCQLEYGVSNVLTMDLGLQRNIGNALSLGASLGVGFESVSRNTTNINDANFTATNMSNPVLNYGAEMAYAFSNRVSVNINAGVLNSYWGDISVLADDGSSIVIEGSTLKSPNASIGLSIGL